MYFDDFDVGFTVKTEPILIERDKMMAFAREYDKIPLHTDDAYGKTTMFGEIIASGFYSALVVYGAFTTDHVWQGGHIAGNRANFEFPKPVYAGDTLRGVVTVTNKKQLDSTKGVIEETLEIFNQSDVLVVRVTSSKFLKTRPQPEE